MTLCLFSFKQPKTGGGASPVLAATTTRGTENDQEAQEKDQASSATTAHMATQASLSKKAQTALFLTYQELQGYRLSDAGFKNNFVR